MFDLPHSHYQPILQEILCCYQPAVKEIVCCFHQLANLAVVVKIPPAKTQDVSYEELVCSDQDKAMITEIIKTISENSKFSLLFNQTYLKQLGTQINHVHPLKFLATVFSDPELKLCMKNIFTDYFKRSGFMEGLAPNLTREMEKGKLEQYLQKFANELNLSHEQLKPYIQSSDWEALVRFMIGE